MKQQIALHAEEGLGMVEPETSNNIGQTQWNLCPQWADVEEDPCAEANGLNLPTRILVFLSSLLQEYSVILYDDHHSFWVP